MTKSDNHMMNTEFYKVMSLFISHTPAGLSFKVTISLFFFYSFCFIFAFFEYFDFEKKKLLLYKITYHSRVNYMDENPTLVI